MLETTGKCSTCDYVWVLQSIQPCRDCKECSGYGGTEDNYSNDGSEEFKGSNQL